ncbi:MAG: shikimate dehydrogenase [Solirubrobacterales bacterium]|nr:shikimate dehydrogenase [Solirubrobacterales bacterium]MBV9425325.1 shikimate dehydrogenase [Solirubrobacterales bacterium]MBV9800305.1 shikimate dehydrogenase [Solirubrobacterales bacterium]
MNGATRLGVLGWPVAHSRSPAMQNAALSAVGLRDWRYQLLPVPPELLAETVGALPGAGFRGANVTIPHKEAALSLATATTPRARAIGAANTLTFDGLAGIHADNTDAPALIQALPFPVGGRTALVLGAGGSARAAVWALLDAGAGEVRVWNRTPERAGRLSADLGAIPTEIAEPADVLVNCTPSGLHADDSTFGELPLSPDALGDFACVVDFVYADTETALIRAARARSLPVIDGLELLVGQGALSFELFTGRRAPVDAMRLAVRASPASVSSIR